MISFLSLYSMYSCLNRGSIRRKLTNHLSSGFSTSTVNPEEVAKFSRMSATWWDPNGPFRPLHVMNPCRMQFIAERVGEHFHNLTPFSELTSVETAPSLLNTSPLVNVRETVGAPRIPLDPRYYTPLQGLEVLDIGCGGGLLCESLARLGAKSVHGIDASESNVKMATLHNEQVSK